MSATPVRDRALIKAILRAVGTNSGSCCSPSRGDTSVIRMGDWRPLCKPACNIVCLQLGWLGP